MAWRALAALAIGVSGAVAAFAVYTFGWQDTITRTVTTTTTVRDPYVKTVREGGRHRVYTLRDGDVVRRAEAAAECGAFGEGGHPNLVCTRIGGGRGSVVFYEDEIQVYDAKSEPFEPSFTVRWKPK